MAAMEQAVFTYGPAARRQAASMLIFAGLALALFVAVLVPQWSHLGVWSKLFVAVLVVILLFTIRAQLARLRFRLRFGSDAARIEAPLSNREIRWADVTLVRRMQMPQFGRSKRWACTLYVRGRRDLPVPILLFDNELVDAERALAEVVSHTPRAEHEGVGITPGSPESNQL